MEHIFKLFAGRSLLLLLLHLTEMEDLAPLYSTFLVIILWFILFFRSDQIL